MLYRKVRSLVFIFFVLLFFVEISPVKSGALLSTKNKSNSESIAGTSGEKPDNTTPQHIVIAYYFHTTWECSSCKKIKAYSQEAIKTGFADELKSGKLQFKSINIDKSENKHYIKDYKLFTKSLVISDIRDGKEVKWENLIKVWQLLKNKEKFIEYVQSGIRRYLEGN